MATSLLRVQRTIYLNVYVAVWFTEKNVLLHPTIAGVLKVRRDEFNSPVFSQVT